MTTPKIPADLLNKLYKKNYCKDGYCFANKYQEKNCTNFQPHENHVCRYPNVCKWQGMGTKCNFGEING